MVIPAVAAAVVGLILGTAIGSYAGYQGMSRREAERLARWEMVPVLTASRLIPAGSRLDYHLLKEAPMPALYASPSMVRSDRAGALVGEQVLVTIRPGDPIFWSYLVSGAPTEVCDWVREAHREDRPPQASAGGPTSAWAAPTTDPPATGAQADARSLSPER